MTMGRKTGGRDWVKGQSGNPAGSKLPEDIKEGRKINRMEVERVFNKLMNAAKDELISIGNDPKTPILEAITARVMAKAYNQGDHQRLNFLLDRLVGKVKETIEHVGPKVRILEKADGTKLILTTEDERESSNDTN